LGGLGINGNEKVITETDMRNAYNAGSIAISGGTAGKPVSFSISVNTLRTVNQNAKGKFIFVLTSSAGTWHLPANIVANNIIPDYGTKVAGKSDISVRVTLTEKAVTVAGAITPVTEFKLQLIDAKGDIIATVDTFNEEIVRTLPVKADVDTPAYWQASIRANATSAWSHTEAPKFIPATMATDKSGKNHVVISSDSNSDYVAVEYKNRMTDIEDHWAEDYIVTAASKRLVAGRADTTNYAPQDDITRAEFITMIARALRLPAAKADTRTYTDTSGHWGATDIMKARSAGLVGLLGVDEFKPDQPITREEMAYVLARAATYIKLEPKSTIDVAARFTDYDTINASYTDHVKTAVSLELLKGKGLESTFVPKDTLTRAEAATVLVRFCKLAEWID
jgi:hypothetical protein